MASPSPISHASTFTIQPGPLSDAVSRAHARLDQLGFADGLWRKRLDVWSADPAIQQLIGNRLGWLDALDIVTPQLPRLRACADAVRRDGFTHVVLLGMGGSSLAPEVLRQVLGSRESVPSFRVLDSVDPDAVRAAMARADTSLFVIATQIGLDDRAEHDGRRGQSPRRRGRAHCVGNAVHRHYRRRHGAAPPVRPLNSFATSSSILPTSVAAIQRCPSSAWCQRR